MSISSGAREISGSRLLSVFAWVSLFAFGACGGAPQHVAADPREIERAESVLLAPFEQAATLVTDDLVVDMTSNFWGAALGLPALSPGSQEQNRKPRSDGGSEFHYVNHAPGASMTFLLGSTQIRVKRSASINVLGGSRSGYTLDVDANGRVSLVDKDGRRDGSRYQVRGGKAVLTP